MPNGLPEYGSVTHVSSGWPTRRESSMSVISSPKIFAMFPRLISSIMRTNRLSGFLLATFAMRLNSPARSS